MKNVALIFIMAVLASPAVATTYSLAPASDGGNDSNSGMSPSTPWLSPNHPVNCGDVIIATPSLSYSSADFASGKWGVVNCPAGNNVAWVKCAAFDACKITATSGEDGMHVSASYWGVQGWEITAISSQDSACFAAAPLTSSASIHHLIFANNIANGCDGGGFVTYNNGAASSDYMGMVGNIAYDAAQGNAFCYSGIAVTAPVNTDTSAGTHIYVGGNFLYHNIDSNPCQNATSTDGEGLIFDTLDGSTTGHPYTGQLVADNNIFLGNGARGFEVLLNQNPTPAIVYVRQNTSWGNGTGTINNFCGEILTRSANSTQIYKNIAVANTATACGNLTHYAYLIDLANSSTVVTNNYADGATSSDYFSEFTSGFSFGEGNISADPAFASPSVPGSPSCGSATGVPNCMATVVANFTPTTAAAKPYGYQIPSAQANNPLFPQWLCNVNLPPGLVTQGCASSSSLPAAPTNIRAIVRQIVADQPPLLATQGASPSAAILSPGTATMVTHATATLQAGPASRSANYYVNAETGDDAYDGMSPTRTSNTTGPWRTLHKAALAVIAGATVHVADGTYEVNGTIGSPTSIETKNSGTAGAWITYVSDNKWGAKIINTNPVNAPNNIAWLVRGDYQIVKDFDISGGPYTGIFVDGNHVQVIGNHLHDILSSSCVNGSFIYVNSPYQYVDSIGNVMHDGGMTPWPSDCGLWHGIYYGGVTKGPVQYGQISNNIIYRVSGYGIHFWHKVSHIDVLNNLIFSNVKGGILIGASDGSTNDYFNIQNNMVIYNSNMIDNSHGPASLGWGISQYVNGGQIGPHDTYLNNLLYGNHASNGWGGSWSNQAVGDHPTGAISGTITADPLLVNYQNSPGVPTIANGNVVFVGADYHPAPASPAKNTGDVSLAPATDIDGALRGKSCDIGPY